MFSNCFILVCVFLWNKTNIFLNIKSIKSEHLENKIIDYVKTNLQQIETDMNKRNSTSKKREKKKKIKTRKKRQELSVSAIKSIKKEIVQIVVKFE